MASEAANLWVLLGLGLAGIFIITKNQFKRVIKTDFGAFIRRLEILPPPEPPDPKAPHSLTAFSFAISDISFQIEGDTHVSTRVAGTPGYLDPELLFLTSLVVVIHAQADQSGFISIDCGIAEGSNYTDRTTGIQYSSDAGFVSTGEIRTVAPNYRTNSVLVQQHLTLRSFPQGTRNCYTLRPSNGKNNKYLIRVRFMYGNYDRQSKLPKFDVHLGVEYWDTVSIDEEDDLIRFEMVHVPTADYINVCFINTGRGTPFVSALELRPLPNNLYPTTSGSLDYYYRRDLGSTADYTLRYDDDNYDRMWIAPNIDNTTTTISTSSNIISNIYDVPSDVMRTAITPQNANESWTISWFTISTYRWYIYAHFAEVEVLRPNQTRSFNVYLNDVLWNGPFSPTNLSSSTLYSDSPENCGTTATRCTFRLTRTENSTLPPSINAFELYQLMNYVVPETDENDFEGIMGIRSAYNVTRNWQGDPCAPREYVWDGVNCSSDSSNPPQIISLDLSSSKLTGRIALPLNALRNLQYLDLSHNNLTGQVPDFLSQMTSLRVLRLNGNNFTGSIPAELTERSRNGLLTLSIDVPGNNTNPCESTPCKGRRNNSSPPIVAIIGSVVGGSLGLLTLGLIFWWIVKKRKTQVVKRVDIEVNENNSSLEMKNKQFTYSEVLKITNNFQRVIGKGGFGTVYHGYDGATQVAVKMLSPSSIQGYKEFQAEVSLLMSVHHKNLTPLVGYCNEGTNMGIIYEYMANGNLEKHILDKNLYVIGWEERLQIAIDAAQGLEYLHHGCKPPIVHRDVKSTNILLGENFQAKLADFGLSRSFPIEGDTHVSTRVAGTPGYLDPEYNTSNRLTEKSDVYGFGIVLLEMVAGRPAIEKSRDSTHIVQWFSSMLHKGNVKNIIDPRLWEEFDVNSVWKVVELAMACASRMSTKRPTMNYVVMELKECLAVEKANRTDSKDSVGVMTMNLESGIGRPRAR